jgi:hypothetical protein
VNAISSQQKVLAEALDADGWNIIHRATNLADWAYYEVWTIESVWRPVGRQAFVAFLMDPHPMSPAAKRPQRKPVWGVECTSTSPVEAGSDRERIALVGITHWDQGVVELVENLAKFRDNAN